MTQDDARQKAIAAGVESLKAGFANSFDHDEWLKALNLALDIFTEQCGFIKDPPKQGKQAKPNAFWQPIERCPPTLTEKDLVLATDGTDVFLVFQDAWDTRLWLTADGTYRDGLTHFAPIPPIMERSHD